MPKDGENLIGGAPRTRHRQLEPAVDARLSRDARLGRLCEAIRAERAGARVVVRRQAVTEDTHD